MAEAIFKGKVKDTGLQSVVSHAKFGTERPRISERKPSTRAKLMNTNETIAAFQELGRSSRGRKKMARILHAIRKRKQKATLARKKKLADLRDNERKYIRGETNVLKSF